MQAQFLPVIVYGLTNYAVQRGLLKGLVPDEYMSWVPMVAAIASFVLVSNYQKQAQSQATSKIIGEAAPDVAMQLQGGKELTLHKLLAEKAVPTVVDFYQSF
mmetsp:Transcript_63823/g.118623  ORF Transcript_63823/g.118623 Transcript_63823/m.118623 type:complete len:102 (-) Transcript_63823:366-671(-)